MADVGHCINCFSKGLAGEIERLCADSLPAEIEHDVERDFETRTIRVALYKRIVGADGLYKTYGCGFPALYHEDARKAMRDDGERQKLMEEIRLTLRLVARDFDAVVDEIPLGNAVPYSDLYLAGGAGVN